jgi:hypothetical protein
MRFQLLPCHAAVAVEVSVVVVRDDLANEHADVLTEARGIR